MICQNCGNMIDDNATICPVCGAQIAAVQQPEMQQPAVDPNAQQAYAQPEYQQPEYQQPGYQQPGYQQPGYQQPGYPQPAGAQKSKLAAGLLGIFLGTFGVHNFYLGRTGKAVAQLLISVLSLGFLSPISGIWGLIEGILILTGSNGFTTDSNGVPLSD